MTPKRQTRKTIFHCSYTELLNIYLYLFKKPCRMQYHLFLCLKTNKQTNPEESEIIQFIKSSDTNSISV